MGVLGGAGKDGKGGRPGQCRPGQCRPGQYRPGQFCTGNHSGEAAGYKETSEPLQNEKHYQLEFPAYIDYSMKNHYNRI